jgi:superoxide dismutase, Fe-Mn family
VLPTLPYPENALAPIISAKTLRFHHGKHHMAYIAKVNELISGTEFEGQTLERIILAVSGQADRAGLFDNAAQA